MAVNSSAQSFSTTTNRLVAQMVNAGLTVVLPGSNLSDVQYMTALMGMV